MRALKEGISGLGLLLSRRGEVLGDHRVGPIADDDLAAERLLRSLLQPLYLLLEEFGEKELSPLVVDHTGLPQDVGKWCDSGKSPGILSSTIYAIRNPSIHTGERELLAA